MDSVDPVDALRQLEDRLHNDLLQNPSYVALLGVRRAIRETVHLVGDKGAVPTRPSMHSRNREVHGFTNPNKPLALSQAEAAYAVLDESIEPLPISELVPRVRARGATVGGVNPELNLSSSLSRDTRFGSIRFNGRPCWAIKEKSYVSSQPIEPTTPEDDDVLMGKAQSVIDLPT